MSDFDSDVTAAEIAEIDAAQASDLTERPAREGLPAGYRMRADRHYVEELTRDSFRYVPAAPSANSSPRQARHEPEILASVAAELASIRSARQLLADNQPLARQAALDMLDAHASRAGWLIQAAQFATATEARSDRRQPLGRIIEETVEQFSAESRLRNVHIRSRVDDRVYGVRFDQLALSAGLTGAIVALIPFVDQNADHALTVSAARSSAGITVDISHPATSIDQSSGSRFFDEDWKRRPGGWPAALGVLALRRSVAHHGGDVSCEVQQGDARIRLSFPDRP